MQLRMLRWATLVAVALVVACTGSDDGASATHDGSAEATETASTPVAPATGGQPTAPEGGATALRTSAGTVRIEVESTADSYYVLYVRPDLTADLELPVSMTLGQDGTTILTEQLRALPDEHYRVEEFSIDDPGDVDVDGIDDITEFGDPVGMNPLNPAPAIDFNDGTVAITDRETFEALSYQGQSVLIDTHLADLEYVKFYLLDVDTDHPSVYFLNTVTHRAHFGFADAVGIPGGRGGRSQRGGGPGGGGAAPGGGGGAPGGGGGAPGGGGGPAPVPGQMRGEIIYHPNVVAPDGTLGVYRYEFEPNDSFSFEEVALSCELLAASMPLLENNLAHYPMPSAALPLYRIEQALYDESRINVLFEDDILPDVDYIPLNVAEGYGLLRVMSLEDRPNVRDVVIYDVLPNELSRVAGMITTVPQTPLSHVNLRAIQDSVPNAFIRDALDDQLIDDLIGKYVHFSVDQSGFTIREATLAEVDAHYAALRPLDSQVPERDLSTTDITNLDEIDFDDWTAFGVKAANVATLGTFGFPDGTVPEGAAVPFYFYDEFMEFNGFYDDVEAMLASPEFQSDYATQEAMLKELRDAIKDAPMPDWMMDALTELQESFPKGTSIRCRSSTNNEDLPGFSGAGLYDSKTQHPDEGHMSKCIKQVYASLWNFRAFAEREFYRVDHLATAMGVLAHPNYSDELANGVAVTTDPVYFTESTYYLNTQIGEDLITNPDALSVPEEVLLDQSGGYEVIHDSNQLARGELTMTDAQFEELRIYLAALYDVEPGEPFAIEIEFKITSDNQLAIKQARPWIFNSSRRTSTH